MRTKLKKTYNILLRIFILAATYGFLYKKIFHDKDWQQQYNLFTGLLEKPGIKTLLFIVVLLMLVNWGLESQKWRFMIGKIERVSFFRSLLAVFTGASISFFTRTVPANILAGHLSSIKPAMWMAFSSPSSEA